MSFPDGAWLADLQASLQRPPLRPRVPLWWGDALVGSVEPEVPRALAAPALLRERGEGWEVVGDDLTASLAAVASALEAAGFAHVRRNEQLPVCDERGAVLGSIERGSVRVLGIATRAVHLLGRSPDGRHWVQQRALDKANDPGLWDTLMGGMVPAAETLQTALERETWEEAGLRLTQLQDLRHGGHLLTRRPTVEAGPGYVVERIDWYRCVVPEGVVPANQDGEVAQFALWSAQQLHETLELGEFTREAAMLFVASGA